MIPRERNEQEEALVVVDDFTARARDLQEGTPGVPADDIDYMAAKVQEEMRYSYGM